MISYNYHKDNTKDKMKKIFSSIKNGFLDSIYPKHIKCIFCGEDLEFLNSFNSCEECLKRLPIIQKDFCVRCGGKLEDEQIGVCFNCKRNNFNFDLARSVFVYADEIVTLIHKFKFGSGKYLAEPIAYYMYNKLTTLNWNIDLISFVPMFPKREKIRGYNQARELANEIGKLSSIPVVNLFEKIVDTNEQAKLDANSRRKNLKGAFKLASTDFKDKNILIVDDIYTTGATTNELAHLLKGKANKIFVLTFAHTKLNEKNI